MNGDGFVADAGVTNFQTHPDRHDIGGRQLLVGDPSGVGVVVFPAVPPAGMS